MWAAAVALRKIGWIGLGRESGSRASALQIRTGSLRLPVGGNLLQEGYDSRVSCI
jgi:hypothetical protein